MREHRQPKRPDERAALRGPSTPRLHLQRMQNARSNSCSHIWRTQIESLLERFFSPIEERLLTALLGRTRMSEKLSAKIGFVIDPAAPVERRIAYVLTADDLQADLWDIWPSSGAGSKAQRSAQEYTEALLLVTSYALSKTSAEKGTKAPPGKPAKKAAAIEIPETDPWVGYWVQRVFNVINAKGQYSAIPLRLRKQLAPVIQTAGSRARTRGRRPKPADRRVVIAGDCEHRVFYWSIQEEPFASMDFRGYLQRNEPLPLSPTPPSSFAIAQVVALAEQVRQGRAAKTWQDLYRQAAIDSEYAPSPKWLQVPARRVGKPAEDQSSPFPKPTEPLLQGTKREFTGPPMRLPELVKQYKKVLLTGPSGSGKTTAFRLLATSWSTEDQLPGEGKLCFYIRLKFAGPFLEECLKKERKADVAALIGRSVASVLSHQCSIEELVNCETVLKFAPARRRQVGTAEPAVDEMLDCVQQEATRWFRDEGCLTENVAVLIDGMNELGSHLRAYVRKSIDELREKPCCIAVSCRSNIADEFFSDMPGQFTRFELQELNDEEMASYIDYRIPGRGKEIFDGRVRADARILSAAKNPFYLSLITERIREEPDANIPSNRALLIADFVRRSVLRKQEEDVFASDTISDSLLATVLPVLAKWSLDSAAETEGQTLFHHSSHFRSIPASSPEVFGALRLAEEYGLLTSSGLPAAFRESRDHPEFSHDNLRDYFAALYLKSLSTADFIQSLPDRVEYFAWDEPLLLFLELGVTAQMLRDVVECVLPADLVLASMCVRCAEGISNDLVLTLERKIRNSRNYRARTTHLPDDFAAYYSRSVCRYLSAHILGRLPVPFLLDLALHSDRDQSTKQFAWAALITGVTPNHLDQLKKLWNSLPHEDYIDRHGVFVAMCVIPTYPALKQVADMWSAIRALPQPSVLAVLPGPSILNNIRYPVSSSEALALFPIGEYEQELRTVVASFAAEEEENVARSDGAAAIRAVDSAKQCAEVLAKMLGKDAIPILRECAYTLSSSSIACDGYEYTYLRPSLFEMIADLDSQQAIGILLENIKADANCHADVETWQLLFKTCRKEVITHAIDCVCQHPGTDASFLCADYLQSFPTRPDVVACFRQYVRAHSTATEAAKLLGAILGLSEFLPDAQQILDASWVSVTLGQSTPSPEHGMRDKVSDRGSNRTRKNTPQGEHRLLALALRAVRSLPPYCDAVKLWTLLGQSCAHLRRNTSNFTVNVELEIVVQCIRGITDILKERTRVNLVSFVESSTFQDLCNLMIRKWPQGTKYWQDRLTTATQDLFTFVIPDSSKYLMLLFRDLYSVLTTHPSGEWIHTYRVANVLLHICRHTGDAQAVSLMQDVEKLSRRTNDAQGQRGHCLGLIDSIRRVRGRRFLGTVGIEPES